MSETPQETPSPGPTDAPPKRNRRPQKPPEQLGPTRAVNDAEYDDELIQLPPNTCRWGVTDNPETGQRTAWTEIIVPCLMDVLSTSIRADGSLQAAVRVTKPDGLVTTRDVDAKALNDPKLLNTWLTSLDVIANLTPRRAFLLRKHLMSQPGFKRQIEDPGHTGYLAEHGVFLCGAHSIAADGTLVPVLDDVALDVKCADGNTRNFRLPPEGIGEVPSFRLAGRMPEDQHYWDVFRRLSDLMCQNLGHNAGALALGWGLSAVFRPEARAHARAFPHLYLKGHAQSGKDVLATWVLQVLGLGHVGGKSARDSTTAKGLRNGVAEVGGLPLWLNELRDDDESRKIMGMVRQIFDGQGGMRARRKDIHTEQIPVRRALMLSGQEVMGDEAEYSRYVLLEMDRSSQSRDPDERRRTKDVVEQYLLVAHEAFVKLCQDRIYLAHEFRRLLPEYEQAIIKSRVGHLFRGRQEFCWAVMLAAYTLATNPNNQEVKAVSSLPPEIWEEALIRMEAGAQESHEDGVLGRFWKTLESMLAKNKLPNTGEQRWLQRFLLQCADGPREAIAIWLDHALDGVEGHRRSYVSDRLLRGELKSLPGFLAASHQVRMVGQVGFGRDKQTFVRRRICWVFDFASDHIPSWVKDETLKTRLVDEEGEETKAPSAQQQMAWADAQMARAGETHENG